MKVSTLLMCCCLAGGSAVPVDAQEQQWTHRRISVAAGIGGTFSGLARSQERQMRDAGFGDTAPRSCFFFCVGPTEFPRREDASYSNSIRVRYAIRERWSVQAEWSNAGLGGADGYRRAPVVEGSYGEYIYSGWTATSTSVAAVYHVNRGASGVAGLTYHQLDNFEPGFDVDRLGISAGIGATTTRRIFLDAQARGHFLPPATVTHRSELRGDSTTFDLRASFVTLTVGVGVRF